MHQDDCETSYDALGLYLGQIVPDLLEVKLVLNYIILVIRPSNSLIFAFLCFVLFKAMLWPHSAALYLNDSLIDRLRLFDF